MYLFLSALVVADPALAGDGLFTPPPIIILPRTCGGVLNPCLPLQDADGEILPPDWLEQARDALGGNLKYFRVEVYVDVGAIAVELSGVELSEHELSVAESGREVSVYYVSTSGGAEIMVTSIGRDFADYTLVVTGQEKSPI